MIAFGMGFTVRLLEFLLIKSSAPSLPGLVGSKVSEDAKISRVCTARPWRHWQGTHPQGMCQDCFSDQVFPGIARNRIIC